MTLDGIPESEREATAIALDPLAARALLADTFDGRVSVVEAADALGLPVSQVVRWAEDGTIPAECVSGRPSRPSMLRIDAAWVARAAEQREVVL